jgi:hypothetical protein
MSSNYSKGKKLGYVIIWIVAIACCASMAWDLFGVLCEGVNAVSDNAYNSAYEMRTSNYQQSSDVAGEYADTNAILAGSFYILFMGAISCTFFGVMLICWHWLLGVLHRIANTETWLAIVPLPWLLLVMLIGVTLGVDYYSKQDPLPIVEEIKSTSIGKQREPTAKIVEFTKSMDQWVKEAPGEIALEDFQAKIYELWPEIDDEIIAELRRKVNISAVDMPLIEYHYFKDGKCDMQNEKGEYVRVDIVGENRFVYRVRYPDGREDAWVSLFCDNGMMKISRESDIAVPALMKFKPMKFETVSPHGLSFYTKSDELSVLIAERFGLKLYKDQRFRKSMTYEEAWAIINGPTTDKERIVVFVGAGWKFQINGLLEEDMQISISKGTWLTPSEFKSR